MFNGWTESAEKIEARKRRILANMPSHRPNKSANLPASISQNAAAELQDMIEQARGQLGIRQLYVRQAQP